MADHESSTEALDAETVDRRSELARCVAPSAFPATREDLVSSLPLDAPEWARAQLAGLTDSERYENFEQVWEALGGERF